MGQKKVRQTNSFQQLVADTTVAKFRPYIQGLIDQLGNQLANQQLETLTQMYMRITVLEQIINDKLGVSKDDLANMLADLEDRNQGLEKAEVVEKGDTVRVEAETKKKDQDKFQGSNRLVINEVGTGKTFSNSPELENALIGAKSGESRDIEFGANKEFVARLTVNRVSRPLKVEKTETPKEEVKNESNDAQV